MDTENRVVQRILKTIIYTILILASAIFIPYYTTVIFTYLWPGNIFSKPTEMYWLAGICILAILGLIGSLLWYLVGSIYNKVK